MEYLQVDGEDFRAESAIDPNQPLVIAHFGKLRFGKARQNSPVMLLRTPASPREVRQLLDANFLFLMKQAPDHRLK